MKNGCIKMKNNTDNNYRSVLNGVSAQTGFPLRKCMGVLLGHKGGERALLKN